MFRLSEVLSQCREPEDLTKILSEELREFLEFLQFYIIVYKENSTEVEWAVVGREKSLVATSLGLRTRGNSLHRAIMDSETAFYGGSR